MKHAVCTVAPYSLLAVSTEAPMAAVRAALAGLAEVPPRLAVYEVADDFELGDLVPDDAGVVWYRNVTRSKEG